MDRVYYYRYKSGEMDRSWDAVGTPENDRRCWVALIRYLDSIGITEWLANKVKEDEAREVAC